MPAGLTQKEAEEELKKFGFNEIRDKKPGIFKKFIKWFLSPISLMLLAAAGLSLGIGKISDFYFILILIALNFLIGFWQEKKADNAIENLQKKLSVKAKVLRDEKWQWIESRLIVPGDVIEIIMGDIVPADVKILEEKNISLNEAVLTGESLSKYKKAGEKCFSGSFVSTGWAKAEVEKTGSNTYFGKIIFSIDPSSKRSILEKDILTISKFLSGLSLAAVLVLTVIFLFRGENLINLVTLDLSLIIAGIPISLPTIMTLIISLGALVLSKKNVIVRRLSSLEDLANVNLLLSDKTGTLTKNEIHVEQVVSYNNFSQDDVVQLAYFAVFGNDRDSINRAILEEAKKKGVDLKYKILDFIPADSKNKRNAARVDFKGKSFFVSDGATQVIESICVLNEKTKDEFRADVDKFAKMGYRSIAVATGENDSQMQLAGILLLSDALEEDSLEAIEYIKRSGIKVKLLTGDNIAIARKVARELNLTGKIINKSGDFQNMSRDELEKTGGFSEILPEDKYELVKLAKKNYVVAVTGDGINDLPALKAADVSIAVDNAVDALKRTADIVLLDKGISVIRDGIIEARKIFSRLHAYSVYRISESFRVIVTIAILGIIYGAYPLTPIHLILLALLNDIPIISLAFNRVKIARKPSKINAKQRFILSGLFGMVGVVNSLLFFFITKNIFNLDWGIIQTAFFLKLTVSGHMLIYIAHTEEKWYRFLPSKQVILATTLTQIAATLFALKGIFVSKIPWQWVAFVWIWALFWMQVSEIVKRIKLKMEKIKQPVN